MTAAPSTARSKEFSATAQDYADIAAELKAAVRRQQEVANEVDRLRSRLAEGKKLLAAFVGRNIESRCARLKDNFTLTVNYLTDREPDVKIFDCEGELVR